MSLSQKQQAFLDAYLITWNEREAARRAGYSAKSAYWLRRHPEISRRIREELEKVSITKEEVLKALARLLRSDIGDAIALTKDENGKDVPTVDIARAVESGLITDVQELKMKRGGLVEMKMPDKIRVLTLLARVLGMVEGEASEAEEEWWKAGEVEPA